MVSVIVFTVFNYLGETRILDRKQMLPALTPIMNVCLNNGEGGIDTVEDGR